MLIFWNHVGREHGILHYTADIRKNEESIITNTLAIKEDYARNLKVKNRFIKHEENILVELPPESSDREFIIIYFIDQGLQFSLNFKTKYPWWVIDIVQIEEIKPNVYCVNDLLLDISVQRDGSYHVLDVDEFEAAISLGVLAPEQISKSLRSFDLITKELNAGGFPHHRIDPILHTYQIELT